jgi:hypothetical protein
MQERRVTREDLENALRSAQKCCSASEPKRWKVTGSDLDGNDLDCVVAMEKGVIVITVF